MALAILAAFFVGPIILGAHLLGASWELALFIGLMFPTAAILAVLAVLAILDGIDTATRRRRARTRRKARQQERR